jgi:hypothetical protein
MRHSFEDVRAARIAPSTPLGVVATTLGTTLAIALIALAMRPGDTVELLLQSFVLASPVSIVALQGHFGDAEWQLPNPGAFVFLFWLLGLCPSLLRVTDKSAALTNFSPDAVLVSRFVVWAWFTLFAFALGRASAPSTPRASGDAVDSSGFGVTFVAIAAAWAVCAAAAAQLDALSCYAASSPDIEVGGRAAVLSGFYQALTPLLAPVAVVASMRGGPLIRRFSAPWIAIGAVGLFIYSERRLWLICVYVCLFLVHAAGRWRWRWAAAGAILVWIGTGPLVTAYRSMRIEPDRAANPAGQVWTALADYATDEEARTQAGQSTSDNLRSRLGISVVLFGVVDEALERGPNLSPSPLEMVVRSVPTFLWPGKNEIADSLSAEQQLRALPRFPFVDLSVTPLTEAVFQVGPWIAPLGGLLYGGMARFANATSARALASGPGLVAWLGFVLFLAHFDGGTAVLSGVREPLFFALVIGVVRRFVWQRPAAAPREPWPFREPERRAPQSPRSRRRRWRPR